jgi:RNA polymerase sigma-70 factor (ECF subfamily)
VHTTHASLLQQLQNPQEHQAWERFVLLYTPLLYQWARRLVRQESDAADLVQDVFTLLYQKLPQFRYDPQKTFRAWLHTVVVNKWRENLRRPMVAPLAGREAPLEELADSSDPVEAITEEEYRQYLARRALQLMQSDFQPATWQAVWETVVCGKAPAEVAAELGITLRAGYLARARVLRRLRDELQGLLD